MLHLSDASAKHHPLFEHATLVASRASLRAPGCPASGRSLPLASETLPSPAAWPSRRLRGAGLGLYIAKAIVEAHAGTFCVTSSAVGALFDLEPRRGSRRHAEQVALLESSNAADLH